MGRRITITIEGQLGWFKFPKTVRHLREAEKIKSRMMPSSKTHQNQIYAICTDVQKSNNARRDCRQLAHTMQLLNNDWENSKSSRPEGEKDSWLCRHVQLAKTSKAVQKMPWPIQRPKTFSGGATRQLEPKATRKSGEIFTSLSWAASLQTDFQIRRRRPWYYH